MDQWMRGTRKKRPMIGEALKPLYVENGFAWHEAWAEFLALHGGRTERITKTGEVVVFDITGLVALGPSAFECRSVSKYFGEDAAPVGRFGNWHTILYLTRSGKLFGICDYVVVRWGDDPHWRTSMERLLEGTEEQWEAWIDVNELWG